MQRRPRALSDRFIRSAALVGRTDRRLLRAVDESLDEVGGDATVSQFLEELVGALACRILTEQRNPSNDRRDGPEEPQVSSDELT
jgi:hypothetical protein